jgi:hypothetical protein
MKISITVDCSNDDPVELQNSQDAFVNGVIPLIKEAGVEDYVTFILSEDGKPKQKLLLGNQTPPNPPPSRIKEEDFDPFRKVSRQHLG